MDTVGDRLGLRPGQACVDIGCGYGSTARRLAVTRGVRVTGFTLSAEQGRYAAAHPEPGVEIQLRDWLANGLADASADAAWAIESSEHMVNKPRFFAEAHRVLAPGGRFVICAWLAETGASGWKVRHLLSRSAARGACARWARARSMRRWPWRRALRSPAMRMSAAASPAPGKSTQQKPTDRTPA